MRLQAMALAFALAARTVWAVSVADFAHAAVTDMNPGALSPVTELEVEGETPYLWYAAKGGTYTFRGDPDGDGLADYAVTVKEAGFYRFRNPGMRFRLVAASAPVALWFGDGPVWYRPVRSDAKLWYAPPDWHVYLDEFPAERAEAVVRKTGCAFLSKERWWHVAPFPAVGGKATALAKEWDEARISAVVAAAAFAPAKKAARVALFNNCLGYRHTGALGAGPVAFAKAAAKVGYRLEVVTDLQKLGDAAFLRAYDAVILNSTSGVEEEKVPGVSRALTEYVASGRGLVLLHAAIDAFYKSPDVQKMNGALLWGHPWSAPGTWSFVNEQLGNPINAPFRDKGAILKYSDEIYQSSTPPFDRANCDVLLSVDMSEVTTAAALSRWKTIPYGRDKWRADNDFVVSYTKTHGRGRVFYTSFGHDGRAFCDERFAHMMLGLQWTLGDLEATAKKTGEVRLDKWSFSRDGKAWQSVSVPHDWAIGEPFDEKADAQIVLVKEDGEKEARLRIGRTGALPWIGSGVYRRTVTIPTGVRKAELWFDGAMANAEVFADGARVGGWQYGYAPFVVPLPTDRPSVQVEVRLTMLPQSSRWYPGAGLIRPVTLRLDPASRVEDVFVRTERIENGRAHLRVTSPAGERTFTVENPKLWTPETPYLYTLEPEGIRYGIRTVEWKDGVFKLNGAVRKFKGVCLHHDLGPVGAAFSKAAFRRQVRLLKEIGCDSIRTSHNIPSSEQMDICDEMGMMVMAESFDEWRQEKCENGYHTIFDAAWRKDLEALVRFHRNHPSIVMWSIGNEILDQRTKDGTRITREMIAFLHEADPTRPVTQGHSWMPYAIDAGGVQEMDIPGVTYRLPFYVALHKASKYGGVLGAETASTVSSRGYYAFPDEPGQWMIHQPNQSSSYDVEYTPWSNLPDDDWAVQDDNTWTMGEFVWTGFDYLGEPAPYDDARSRSSYFGIYDLAGLPKDRAYLYRARWRTDEPTLHVLPHWTWPDRIGKVTPVYVYTSYPEAELFVNGKSQGRRKFDKTSRLDRYRLRWRNVVYEPGELKVVAYDGAGRAVAERRIETAGEPHHLVLTPEPTVAADDDLRFVTVDVVDAKGRLCPQAAVRVNFSVAGATQFVAAANGDPTDFDTLSVPSRKTFNGRMTVVLKVADGSAPLLSASCPELPVCGK